MADTLRDLTTGLSKMRELSADEPQSVGGGILESLGLALLAACYQPVPRVGGAGIVPWEP